MNLYIKDWSAVSTPSGPCIRFSVTVADDTGEPLITQSGFMLDNRRKVIPPRTRVKFGRMAQFTVVSPKFETMVREVAGAIQEVQEILGPLPEEDAEREAKKLHVGEVKL